MLQRLEEMRAASRAGGGEARVKRQHERGKLTARERLEVLLDADSFDEWDAFVAMVRGAAPSPVNLADGRAPLVMGLAAWKSVREGRPVAVAEIG